MNTRYIGYILEELRNEIENITDTTDRMAFIKYIIDVYKKRYDELELSSCLSIDTEGNLKGDIN